jgi:NAD-dependent dihydropyrimidine dehydrogenase PreA subunit
MEVKESVKATRKKRSYKVEVDQENCIGCEECVENCPADVFEMKNEKSLPVHMDECIGCDTCVEACDQDAITVTEID